VVTRATPVPDGATERAEAPGDAGAERTMLRSGQAEVTRSNGAASDIGAAELDHARPADVSLPARAPRSKAPIIGVGVLVVVVAAVGVWAGFGRTEPRDPPAVVGGSAGASVQIDTPNTASGPGTNTPPPPQVDDVIKKAMREQHAVQNLADGRTALEVAKLDEAETYLSKVPDDTPSFEEAKSLIDQIATIRRKLAEAKALRAKGQCGAALPVYQAVLKLNSKVAEAAEGVSACRASQIDTTIE
jgi:hypothetical protein